MKILLAVDGSEFSARATREVVRLARELRKTPTVVVLTVDAPLMKSVVAHIGAEQASRYHEENAALALREPRSILRRARVAFAEEMRLGDPGAEIAEVAKDGRFDLVVMGSHGRGAVRNLVMGSVVTKMLAAGEVPVLVVR